MEILSFLCEGHPFPGQQCCWKHCAAPWDRAFCRGARGRNGGEKQCCKFRVSRAGSKTVPVNTSFFERRSSSGFQWDDLEKERDAIWCFRFVLSLYRNGGSLEKDDLQQGLMSVRVSSGRDLVAITVPYAPLQILAVNKWR